MKKIALLPITLVLVLCFIPIADDCSAAEPPSVGEIFGSIHMPDYTLSTFLNDAKTVFSEGTMNQFLSLFSGYGEFVSNNTFVGDIAKGNLSAESFSWPSNFINISFLLCILIAIMCVAGAIISYHKNKDVFESVREKGE